MERAVFKEPKYLVLDTDDEDALTASILLIYEIIVAIAQPLSPPSSPQSHVHSYRALLKEIIDILDPEYWRLSPVEEIPNGQQNTLVTGLKTQDTLSYDGVFM